MKERPLPLIAPKSGYEIGQLECGLYKMKNPVVVGFITEDQEHARSSSIVHTAVRRFHENSFFPVYIVKVSNTEDEIWAVHKFKIRAEFPSITVWTGGDLAHQIDPDLLYIMDADKLYYSLKCAVSEICLFDVRAYKLWDLYEAVMREMKYGGENNG